ncbi:uncharacterized protein CANTADRAFT_6292 [Suhomyces tanzawaensis NRRL Y-17324]|uniref:Uncharacterized protein n=1 Tax=Suhomyces tanzawaensis NRRL Y-17324 TaxID=984487 RepID=A0A1E4SHZ0_9ASCO|nr:uncharacterized protein CANTADRAFT_6292 [Suhomyces tanzawaensis NRRL Y-17324]ODV79116.1 hypothetical protein CANTADRAFT_6292 [Suhomyces tanzawaensis NRRL Y-17324]
MTTSSFEEKAPHQSRTPGAIAPTWAEALFEKKSSPTKSKASKLRKKQCYTVKKRSKKTGTKVGAGMEMPTKATEVDNGVIEPIMAAEVSEETNVDVGMEKLFVAGEVAKAKNGDDGMEKPSEATEVDAGMIEPIVATEVSKETAVEVGIIKSIAFARMINPNDCLNIRAPKFSNSRARKNKKKSGKTKKVKYSSFIQPMENDKGQQRSVDKYADITHFETLEDNNSSMEHADIECLETFAVEAPRDVEEHADIPTDIAEEHATFMHLATIEAATPIIELADTAHLETVKVDNRSIDTEKHANTPYIETIEELNTPEVDAEELKFFLDLEIIKDVYTPKFDEKVKFILHLETIEEVEEVDTTEINDIEVQIFPHLEAIGEEKIAFVEDPLDVEAAETTNIPGFRILELEMELRVHTETNNKDPYGFIELEACEKLNTLGTESSLNLVEIDGAVENPYENTFESAMYLEEANYPCFDFVRDFVLIILAFFVVWSIKTSCILKSCFFLFILKHDFKPITTNLGHSQNGGNKERLETSGTLDNDSNGFQEEHKLHFEAKASGKANLSDNLAHDSKGIKHSETEMVATITKCEFQSSLDYFNIVEGFCFGDSFDRFSPSKENGNYFKHYPSLGLFLNNSEKDLIIADNVLIEASNTAVEDIPMESTDSGFGMHSPNSDTNMRPKNIESVIHKTNDLNLVSNQLEVLPQLQTSRVSLQSGNFSNGSTSPTKLSLRRLMSSATSVSLEENGNQNDEFFLLEVHQSIFELELELDPIYQNIPNPGPSLDWIKYSVAYSEVRVGGLVPRHATNNSIQFGTLLVLVIQLIVLLVDCVISITSFPRFQNLSLWTAFGIVTRLLSRQ